MKMVRKREHIKHTHARTDIVTTKLVIGIEKKTTGRKSNGLSSVRDCFGIVFMPMCVRACLFSSIHSFDISLWSAQSMFEKIFLPDRAFSHFTCDDDDGIRVCCNV